MSLQSTIETLAADGIFIAIGQQQFEARADLAQQLLPTRALRGEIQVWGAGCFHRHTR